MHGDQRLGLSGYMIKQKQWSNSIFTDAKDVFALLKGRERKVAPGEEPTFTWFKSGQEFDPEDRFKVLFKDEEDTLALVFQHINPEDAGLYTCVASTSTGKISCSAELSVEGGVTQLLKVRSGSHSLLHCIVLIIDQEIATLSVFAIL